MDSRTTRIRLKELLVFLALMPLAGELSAQDRIHIVNSTGDAGDSNLAARACGTGIVLDGGEEECTLRAAIEQANALGGTQTIRFMIPGGGVHTSTPATPLPSLTPTVIIDGYTQPGTSIFAGPDATTIDATIGIVIDCPTDPPRPTCRAAQR